MCSVIQSILKLKDTKVAWAMRILNVPVACEGLSVLL